MIAAASRRRMSGFAARLRASAIARRIAANAGWLLVDRLIRLALTFVVGAWVARYLGPDRFGHLAYVFAFVAFFQTAANLGADSIVVRDIARDSAAAPSILGSMLRLRMLAGFVCWLAAVALTVLVDPSATETIMMTAIVAGAVVFQAADTVDLWFQSQLQSRRTVIAKLTAYVLTNGLKIVLVLAKAPLIAFAAAFLFDFIAAAIALAVAYRTLPTTLRWSFDAARARMLLTESWPFLLSGLSIIIYMRIDLIMLKALRSDYEVGVFAAAMPLSQIWQMIPLTLASSLAPYIAQRKLAGEDAYERAMVMIFRGFAALSVTVAIATALVAPVLVPLIYGARFTGSVDVLRILVFTNLFVAIGVAQGLWIANNRAGPLLVKQTICGAIVAVVGNWLVIPRWGAEGAAVVALVSYATSAMLVNIVFAPRLFALQCGWLPRGRGDPTPDRSNPDVTEASRHSAAGHDGALSGKSQS